jgi:hypothetical protein
MTDWGSLPEEWRGIHNQRQQSLLFLIPFNYGFSLVVSKFPMLLDVGGCFGVHHFQLKKMKWSFLRFLTV